RVTRGATARALSRKRPPFGADNGLSQDPRPGAGPVGCGRLCAEKLGAARAVTARTPAVRAASGREGQGPAAAPAEPRNLRGAGQLLRVAGGPRGAGFGSAGAHLRPGAPVLSAGA